MDNKIETAVEPTPKHYVVVFNSLASECAEELQMGDKLFKALQDSKFAKLVEGLNAGNQLPEPISRHDVWLVETVTKLGEFDPTFDWTTEPIYSDSYTIVDDYISVDYDSEQLLCERVICGSELIVIKDRLKDAVIFLTDMKNYQVASNCDQERMKAIAKTLAGMLESAVGDVMAELGRLPISNGPGYFTEKDLNDTLERIEEFKVKYGLIQVFNLDKPKKEKVFDVAWSVLASPENRTTADTIAPHLELLNYLFTAFMENGGTYGGKIMEMEIVGAKMLSKNIYVAHLEAINHFENPTSEWLLFVKCLTSRIKVNDDFRVTARRRENDSLHFYYVFDGIEVKVEVPSIPKEKLFAETFKYANNLLGSVNFQQFLSMKHLDGMDVESIKAAAFCYVKTIEAAIEIIGRAPKTTTYRSIMVEDVIRQLAEFKISFGLN